MAKRKIGKMNQRVIFQSQGSTKDGYGGFDDEWVTAFTVWASYRPRIAAYLDEQGQRKINTIHMVRTRFRADFHPELRLKIGARHFEIESYYNDEEDDYYTFFQCRELVT
jgi:SPP1 family predicted phage head-tail adaptor